MNGYLTDEELELLIEQMEEQELYAPGYMKEQILNQAFPRQTVEVLPKSGGRERNIQFFSYRLKMIAGMAAAVFMLAVLPIQEKSREPEKGIIRQSRAEWMQEEASRDEREMNVNHMLNESARRANQKINTWFSRISNWQKESLYQENGGIYYED